MVTFQQGDEPPCPNSSRLRVPLFDHCWWIQASIFIYPFGLFGHRNKRSRYSRIPMLENWYIFAHHANCTLQLTKSWYVAGNTFLHYNQWYKLDRPLQVTASNWEHWMLPSIMQLQCTVSQETSTKQEKPANQCIQVLPSYWNEILSLEFTSQGHPSCQKHRSERCSRLILIHWSSFTRTQSSEHEDFLHCWNVAAANGNWTHD